MRGLIGRLSRGFRLALVLLAIATAAVAQIPSRNVNMVSGTGWPDGDPFLQRQNEPTIAVSTRNPMHLLAGANDYRTVDLPGLPDDAVTGDAWLGVFTSYDAGATWKSTLLPGYPQETGSLSPLHGYEAAADPVVRAGTHGLFYYSGIAFDRDNPVILAKAGRSVPKTALAGVGGASSSVFVARFIDNNNRENGEPIAHLGTSVVATDIDATESAFLDKPWLAVDMPRKKAGTCTITQNLEGRTVTQAIPAGNVYVAWARFTGSATGGDIGGRIYFSRSLDCGSTWSTPTAISGTHHVNQGATIAIDPRTGTIYVVWRRFRWPLNSASPTESDAILISRSFDRGATFTAPQLVASFQPFDQGTYVARFRTNAYPTAAVDRHGRVYVAFSARGAQPSGDARVVLTQARFHSRAAAAFADEDDGAEKPSPKDPKAAWTTPTPVDPDAARRGHQLMPAAVVMGSRVQISYVDLQEDHTWADWARDADGVWRETRVESEERAEDPETVFLSDRIDDAAPPLRNRRHTADVWVAQAVTGDSPAFVCRRASSYAAGARKDQPETIRQLQFNPPNLPLFKLGTRPFWGDYIDLASLAFEQKNKNKWRYSTKADTSFLTFTDNRDVRPPFDGDWTRYTPPASAALGATSLFDGRTPVSPCTPDTPERAGMRNQNIYMARVTQGLFVGVPGNTKPLGTLQRAFVVTVENETYELKTFRLTITRTPPGGVASFRQFSLLIAIDVTIGPRSSISRTVFVQASDPKASAEIAVQETRAGAVVTPSQGGLEGQAVLNPEMINPEMVNPEMVNPEMVNDDVLSVEVHTPEMVNPEMVNPEMVNPEMVNPEMINPEMVNPEMVNPEMINPEMVNPEMVNPEMINPEMVNPEMVNTDLVNGSLTDTTWTITNLGNTTSAYDVRLLLRNTQVPEGFKTHLILYKTYATPVTRDCELSQEAHNVLVASIPSPRLDPVGTSLPYDPADGSLQHATLWLAPGESGKITLRVIDPNKADDVTFDPLEDVAVSAKPHAVDTEDAAAGVTDPPAVTTSPVVFEQRPLSTPVGGYVTPPVRVLAQDETGAALANVPVTLSLSYNPAGATLHNATATTDGAGVATFPALWLDRPGVGYKLRATVGTVTSSATPPFDVVPLVVTRTDDAPSAIPGSLRAAIENANRNAGYPDAISFDIGGGGVHTIAPTSPLPGITDALTIDGTTQPGYAGTPLIELNGAAAGATWGLYIPAGGSTVRGLAINGFAFEAVRLIGGGGNVIQGNFIGTDATGSVARPNNEGVFIATSSNNRIGGTSAAERNVISGNLATGINISGTLTTGNEVLGNFIGTNAAGNAALGNVQFGVFISNAPGNVIGGSSSGAGNVISSNGVDGIRLSGAGNRVIGNRIGTDSSGSLALGNAQQGVVIYGDDSVVRGNVISGHALSGVGLGTGRRTLLEGNYIGTNSAGTGGVPNAVGVMYSSSGPTDDAIRDNVISGNSYYGMWLTNAAHVTITGNRIGTTATGSSPLPNGSAGYGSAGVRIDGCINTRIGRSGLGGGNLVSGNQGDGLVLGTYAGFGLVDCIVEGNLIGTDVSGAMAMPNASAGLRVNPSLPAGSAPMSGVIISGNVVSGNVQEGISIANGVHHLTVASNTIGTDLAGSIAIPNGSSGVFVFGDAHDIAIGPGNLIAGNVGHGVNLVSPSSSQPLENNVISENLIGTNRTGTAAIANEMIGVAVAGLGARTNRVVGNLISGNGYSGVSLAGNTEDNVVVGNRIGTNAAGTAALPNVENGVYVAGGYSNVIGGSAAGEGNLISGNGGTGVWISSGGANLVRGNVIGLNVSGTTPLGNGVAGVRVGGAYLNNRIGGPGPGEGNVISGNPVGVSVEAYGTQIVEGNRIGTNAAGDAAVGNTGDGVFLGTTEGPMVRGNLVSANGGCGIAGGGDGTQITGNAIGTNLAGTGALGNATSGICVSMGNASLLRDNLVSGNQQHGIQVTGGSHLTISANRVGTDAAGTGPLPNELDGIDVTGGGSSLVGGSTAAEGNTVAFNRRAGIAYLGAGTSAFGSNRTVSNGGLGIDLGGNGVTDNDPGDGDSGANDLLNFPVLTSAVGSATSTVVAGTLSSIPGAMFTIQIFSSASCDVSGNGEGEVLEGSTTVVTNSPGGDGSFTVNLPRNLTGRFITATTSTSLAMGGRTSEFAACREVDPQTIIVDTFDAGGTFHPADNIAAAGGHDLPLDVIALRAATRFTVTGSDYELTAITLPISFQGSIPATLRVRLASDAGGSPGTTLEVLSENQAWPALSNPFSTKTTLTSTGHSVLSSGVSYWIVTELTSFPTGGDADFRWFYNQSGVALSVVQQQATGSLPSDPWTGVQGLRPVALRVEGTPVP